jgi:formylglycine-generating enzyme required for sulfatase activity
MPENGHNQPRGPETLSATEFSPLETPHKLRKWSISPGLLILGVVSVFAVLVLGYLFMARAVIFLPEPITAEINVSGVSFNIGNNFLLLRGEHTINADAEGYRHFEELIPVSGDRSQEISIQLEPLPGRLELISELADVSVLIDDERAETAPGVIEEISKGSHIIEFSKHRYFTGKQEIEIEGLGRTQSLSVALEPAWGQMDFTTAPEGVELYIDGELIGQTPLSTEVLETGSQLSISARGYKTYEKEIFIKAGATEAYPPVTLIVADGILKISSTPRGASVTVGGEFRGQTPLSVPLSPLRDHRIELFLEGYRKAVRTAGVEPEQSSGLSVSLTAIIGRINVNVSPEDSTVVVDGNDQGRGDRVLSLTAKEHEISIRKPGFAEQSFKITPRPELEQALEVSLLTLQQDYWSTRPPQIRSPLGARMILFRPDAEFSLGAPRREPGRRANEAERNVHLERPFYIGTHEISNSEFRRWKEEHSSSAMRGQTLDMDSQPAVNLRWEEAAYFCNWLSRQEGLPLFYLEENGAITGINVDSHGYRMPTEAEWAWMAKIESDDTVLMFPWGDESYPPDSLSGNYADQSAVKFLSFTLSNYNDGFPVSAKVGSFEPNSKGIYDLSGNVAEWISDFYDIRPLRGAPEVDPLGPEVGNRHVIRGASWAMGSRSELRLSYRDAGSDGRMDTGFRLARYVDRAGVEQ